MHENNTLHIDISLFKNVRKALLAVSGGADSVAMVHALAELKKKGKLSCDFVIGHINHNLRGKESDADEVFVKGLAESLGLEVYTKSVDVMGYAKEHTLSIETAGRKLRLRALEEMAKEHHCRRIATAHHADDQAETLIHRLMRGTGFRGLSGIQPVSLVSGAVYIRPMLNIRRSEIIQYCNNNSIQWRQDKSNSDLQFTRNRIRHKLLPLLRQNLVGTAGRTSNLTDLLLRLSKSAQHLQKRVDEAFQKSLTELCMEKDGSFRIGYNQNKLKACSPWTFYEIVRQGIVTIGGGLRGYSRSHFDTIRDMANQTKAKADFPGKLEVIVENGTLMIQRKGYKPSARKQEEGVVLWPGHTVEFGQWKISSRLLCADKEEIMQFLKTKNNDVEWFDANKTGVSVVIRSWRDGDRFRPIGGWGKKKVARFLQDSQLDASMRKNAFIVSDGEEILWVAPIRMSEQAKVTDKTIQILEIKVH